MQSPKDMMLAQLNEEIVEIEAALTGPIARLSHLKRSRRGRAAAAASAIVRAANVPSAEIVAMGESIVGDRGHIPIIAQNFRL